MKCSLAWITIAALFSVALAQQNSPTAGDAAQSPLLENGTIMYLELSKSVDARKAKAGDEVRASLLANVLSHGKIVLRQDARLIGHVTEAQAFSKDKPESRLGVVFDKAIGKGGQEVPFNSVLLAIRPAPRLQVSTMNGPAPLNINPANPQQQDGHYARPKPAGTPMSPSDRDQYNRKDHDRVRTGSNDLDMQPTDIEGLSLEPATDGTNRVVVSFKNNVKLESGVQLELRVINPGAANKAAAQAP
jgi:hypothetical protein